MKFLILFMTISLVGCGQRSTEKKINQSVNCDSIKIQNSNDKSVSKDYEKLGFDLMKNETLDKLKLGLKVSALTNFLGEPSDKSKNELWGADGEYHQTYKYSNLGIELDMMGEKESDKVINMITIVNQCEFKTSKGISIGSSYQEVEQVYNDYLNSNFSNRESIVAGSIYGGVIFSFEKGKVKSIFIGASAE